MTDRETHEPVFVTTTSTGSDGSTTAHTQRVDGAEICTECWEVCGVLRVERGAGPRVMDQRCRCQRKALGPAEWPGWDISTAVELCWFCAIEPIRCGTRWSVFFCDECRPLVVSLNKRFHRRILPIGRHSIMNGVALGPDTDDVERFTGRLLGLFDAIDHLESWTRARTEHNVRVLSAAGLLSDPDAASAVDLAAYVRAAAEARLSKLDGFHGVLRHFNVPG